MGFLGEQPGQTEQPKEKDTINRELIATTIQEKTRHGRISLVTNGMYPYRSIILHITYHN
ncbi:hypothetical protein [Neobacillus massiliamazoniensis]|uniref:hypothetical protein n=1 Tax=Neobacillus massiliamazoniensis TaxID=1499688 RepID=UPI000A9DFBD1|nr:hypothetical protein [Neobacillus massiliamazoniensis]